jgi:hypothetical protein
VQVWCVKSQEDALMQKDLICRYKDLQIIFYCERIFVWARVE